jgi:outer membrane protein assembly factor BamA
MWRRGYLLFTLTCLMCVLLCSSPTSAQISRRLNRCLPYPSLADEINDVREEVRAKIAATTGATAPARTVVIDDVKFDGPTHLPEATRERLVAELKQGTYEADSGWLVQLQNGSIPGAWQDDGFFKAQVTATASVINTDSTVEHVLLTIHADEGHQYEIGGIQFRSSDPTVPLIFSSTELRNLFQMHEGDILRAQKIRDALDALNELYGSRGYIDFVATPITDIDDETGRISLMMELDQEKQFRLAKIEVFGTNPNMVALVQSKFKPGDVVNSQLIKDFLTENKSSLPPDVSFQDVDFHRNVNIGTVDLRFNFQTCEQLRP